jgi:hypothetical protein
MAASPSPSKTWSRSTRYCPDTSICSCRLPAPCAAALTGSRATTRPSAVSSSCSASSSVPSALPTPRRPSSAFDHLRGPAHRPRLRHPGQHGPHPQSMRQGDGLLIRAAKTVALLELIQDVLPTDAKLVAQCLYDRWIAATGHRDHRRSGDTAPAQPARLLREDRLQDPVERRRGVGARAPRHPVPRETIGDGIKQALDFLLATRSSHVCRGAHFLGPAFSPTGRSHADSGFEISPPTRWCRSIFAF